MLTTSLACPARHSSSRIVRSSRRAVSPSREIWPDFGLTHQSPMRSIVVVGRSIRGVVIDDTNTVEKRRPELQQRPFRSIQGVSDQVQHFRVLTWLPSTLAPQGMAGCEMGEREDIG